MTDTTTRIYEENLQFWEKAWRGVRDPYRQVPDLDYISRIPDSLCRQKSARLLDLGCGSGWLSVYLARAGFNVTGVDTAVHAVELAKSWAAQEKLDIDFQNQDITRLNFPEAYFGAVVANSIFEHLTFNLSEKTVSSIRNLLAVGGLFLGCFDRVGTGPGQYYKLEDGTHVYTDKIRQGMILRCYTDSEIRELFSRWKIEELSELSCGTRFLLAANL